MNCQHLVNFIPLLFRQYSFLITHNINNVCAYSKKYTLYHLLIYLFLHTNITLHKWEYINAEDFP